LNNLDQGLFRLDSGLTMCPGLNGKSIKLGSQKCRASFLERAAKVVDEEPDPAHPAQIAVQENPGRTPLVELGAGNALELGEDRRDPGRKEGHPRAGMDQVQMHFRVGHRVADARLWEGGFLHPRKSLIDVVQSVGRVMRRAEGKKMGYVILPVGVPAGVKPEVALKDNERYRVVWQILNALSVRSVWPASASTIRSRHG